MSRPRDALGICDCTRQISFLPAVLKREHHAITVKRYGAVTHLCWRGRRLEEHFIIYLFIYLMDARLCMRGHTATSTQKQSLESKNRKTTNKGGARNERSV